MPIRATLDSLSVNEANADGGNGAEWRLLFSSQSPQPPFSSVWSQNRVFDGQSFGLGGQSFTTSAESVSLRVSGFENDGRGIETRDLFPSISLDFRPAPGGGSLPLQSGGFDYELTVRVGVGQFLGPEITQLVNLLQSRGEPHDNPFNRGGSGTGFLGLPSLDTGGLPPDFSDRDFGYAVDFRVTSTGSDQPVTVTVERLHVLQAGEDGDNGLAEWHSTFAAGTFGSLQSFPVPELRIRGTPTFDLFHTFTVDPAANSFLILRTGGLEDDGAGGLLIGSSFLDRIFGGASFNSPEMLAASELTIRPFGNGFGVTAAVNDADMGAYTVTWHVDVI